MFLLPTSHCDGSTNTAELQAIGAVGELRDGGQWLQTKEVSLHHWGKTEGASVNTSPLTPPCLLGLTPTVPQLLHPNNREKPINLPTSWKIRGHSDLTVLYNKTILYHELSISTTRGRRGSSKHQIVTFKPKVHLKLISLLVWKKNQNAYAQPGRTLETVVLKILDGPQVSLFYIFEKQCK